MGGYLLVDHRPVAWYSSPLGAEEAKLLSRKAEAALVLVGGGSANALQLQRNTLESLDAAEQMQELEMQKEALELEEKESQLLKESP